ncbi:MAG: DNA cytosine methyltransferase [Pseudomonadota bacterium]
MRSVELFAGAGGLGIGLHHAGFHPQLVVEIDKYCCDTIRENQERGVAAVEAWNLFDGDVRDYDFRALEDRVDLVSGGPPCQPFSLGGKHRAHQDRRDMFPEAIRAIRETRPQAFILENVKGLKRTSFRNYFEYIRLQLMHPEIVAAEDESWQDHLARLEQHHLAGAEQGLGYTVLTELLNAADFGIPQRRERVFFVGYRHDLNVTWSFPKATHSADALAWDKDEGDYWSRHGLATRSAAKAGQRALGMDSRPSLQPWVTVRDALSDLPDPESSPAAVEIANHRFQPGARSYKGHTGSEFDLPAKTLKAGVHGVPGGENMLRRDDESVRYFTVRESARLQTFPDDYVFHGSWSETMRQLGNAVPVDLGAVVGKSVRRALDVLQES